MTFDVFADPQSDAPEDVFVAFLEDESLDVRWMAANALAGPWRNRDQLYVALVERILEVEGEERSRLIQILGSGVNRSGPPPVGALPGLIAMSDLDHPWIGRIIPELIYQTGPPSPRDLSDLAERARAQIREGRRFPAARALVMIAPNSPEARSLIPGLVETLERERNEERFADAHALLTWVGPFSSSATPALRLSLENSDPEIRRRAKEALDQIAKFDTQGRVIPGVEPAASAVRTEPLPGEGPDRAEP
jgi:hypothetical protein